MTLVDRLQGYLKRLRDRPGSFVPPSGEELAQLRRHLRSRCEERASKHQNRLAESFQERLKYLDDFVYEICWNLDALAIDEDEKLNALRTAIDHDLPKTLRARIHASLASRPIWYEALFELVRETTQNTRESSWANLSTIACYAAELRLTRTEVNHPTIAPMGEVLLHLVGRDAIRWLLAIEVVQSVGSDDPWRMSRKDASQLATEGLLWPEEGIAWSSHVIDRCCELQLLRFSEFKGPDYGPPVPYGEVTPLGRELLAEAGSQETPFTLLAQALSADQTQAVLAPSVQTTPGTAAEATVRHTRMVAHEIRNALVPVRIAVKQLWRDLNQNGQDGLTAEHRAIIDNNIERIFKFVDESVRLTRLASEPPEIFDVLPAIRDAVGALDRPPRRPIEPTLGPGTNALRVRGHRQRLVLALINLLRNAVQAKGPDVSLEIQVSALPKQGRFQIAVDDDGPGIPLEQRMSIFQNGVSHHSDGAGHGLTLVREVIEREMSGKITCEESQRGGARFVIELPWA